MTLVLIVNAILAAVVFSVVIGMIGWTIRTSTLRHPAGIARSGARPAAARRSSARPAAAPARGRRSAHRSPTM